MPMTESANAIQVAAGVLADASGRVLLMQRLPGKHLAGLWEFPGGKLEPGESIERALARELAEELGIEAHSFAPLISIPWRYPEKSVRLHALPVTAWTGEPRAREGHPLRWAHVREIQASAMPAADAPILAALGLPPYYGISGDSPPSRAAPNPAASIRHADAVLWQLRMPGASQTEVRSVARAWLDADPSLQTRLLVNQDVELARELGIGVHLKGEQLRESCQRPLPASSWVGASCHDAEGLEWAARVGADFATLSPVRETASHPGAPPLGWNRFASLVADARLPVYALGGLGPEDLEQARVAGGQGVAGIRAFHFGA